MGTTHFRFRGSAPGRLDRFHTSAFGLQPSASIRALDDRGTALLEAAVTIPILLLIAVGIFEFGRAYQTWQVLTNAAREGARVAVLPNTADATVVSTVRNYMTNGALPNAGTAAVGVTRNATVGAYTASRITVDYPFQFIVLQPVARLVAPGARTGAPLMMHATAVMRNETQ
jgi:Flp pilus assembly protein TadG